LSQVARLPSVVSLRRKEPSRTKHRHQLRQGVHLRILLGVTKVVAAAVQVLKGAPTPRGGLGLNEFVRAVGEPEACSMLFALTAHADVFSHSAVEKLSDAALVGVPRWLSDDAAAAAVGAIGGAGGGASAATDPVWSAMHQGLSLYLYRMLSGLWDKPLLSDPYAGTQSERFLRGVFGARSAALTGIRTVVLAHDSEGLEELRDQLANLAQAVPRVLERYRRNVSPAGGAVPQGAGAAGGEGPAKRARRDSALDREAAKVLELGFDTLSPASEPWTPHPPPPLATCASKRVTP
jgi:hypothetical protein